MSRAPLVIVTAALLLTACQAPAREPATRSAADTSAAATTGAPSAHVIPSDPAETPDAAFLDRGDEDELMRQWWLERADCYTEQGFPAHHDGEGLTIEGGGPEQREPYRAAGTECDRRVGEAPANRPYTAQSGEVSTSCLWDP